MFDIIDQGESQSNSDSNENENVITDNQVPDGQLDGITGELDLNEVPEEYRDIVREYLDKAVDPYKKSLLGDYTKKTQQIAETKKKLKRFEDLEVDPDQILNALEYAKQGYAPNGYQQQYNQQQQSLTGNPEWDNDIVIQKAASSYAKAEAAIGKAVTESEAYVAQSIMEQAQAQYQDRIEKLQERAARSQEKLKTDEDRLLADPVWGKYVEIDDVKRFMRKEGYPSLLAAAKVLYMDEYADDKESRARNTVTKSRDANLNIGKSVDLGGVDLNKQMKGMSLYERVEFLDAHTKK